MLETRGPIVEPNKHHLRLFASTRRRKQNNWPPAPGPSARPRCELPRRRLLDPQLQRASRRLRVTPKGRQTNQCGRLYACSLVGGAAAKQANESTSERVSERAKAPPRVASRGAFYCAAFSSTATRRRLIGKTRRRRRRRRLQRRRRRRMAAKW